jgi:hypothetical protein
MPLQEQGIELAHIHTIACFDVDFDVDVDVYSGTIDSNISVGVDLGSKRPDQRRSHVTRKSMNEAKRG